MNKATTIFMAVAFIFVSRMAWAADLTIVFTAGTGVDVTAKPRIQQFVAELAHAGLSVLLVDAGDALFPAEDAFRHARYQSLSVQAMNSAGYHAWLPGPTDLDSGRFGDAAGEADFSVLAANLHRAETGRPPLHVQPFTILRVGDLRVGVIGLASKAPGYAVGAPVDAAQYYLPIVAARSDVIIVVSDATNETAQKLAALAEVDVVLNRRSGSETRGTVALGTFIAQVGSSVAGVDLSIAEGRVTEGAVRAVDPPSADAGPILSGGWTVRIEGQPVSLDTVLGESEGGFTPEATGYLIADAVRHLVGSDVALIRSDVVGPGPIPGPFTVLDLLKMYTSHSTIGVATVKGSDVRAFLSSSSAGRHRYYPSGIDVVYTSTPKGTDTVAEVTLGGGALDDRKDYTVALSTAAHARFRLRDTGVLIRDILARMARTTEQLKGVVDGRIQNR